MARTDDIIEIARSWIGTPYHHQASLKGVGCDCVGLVRGVYKELYGRELPELINYSTDWGDSNGNEDMVEAAHRHFDPLPLSQRGPGHMVLIRWKKKRVAKHSMIMTAPMRAIHAYNGNPVTEINLNKWWIQRIVYVFAFPMEVK